MSNIKRFSSYVFLSIELPSTSNIKPLNNIFFEILPSNGVNIRSFPQKLVINVNVH